MLTGFDLCRAAMAVEGITAPEQSVLTTLAITANDDAQCWPGIAWLVARTKLSERTVQRSLQGLKEAGHINWVDKPGRGRVYVVHPRQGGTAVEPTPATVAPRQPDTRQSDTPATVTPTPATVAPKQPRTTIPQKTSSSSAERAPTSDPFPKPEWADGQVWRDFLANRKRKRLGNTVTAHKGFLEDIERETEPGWPPGRLLEAATRRGHGAIYPSIKDSGNAEVRRNCGTASRTNDGFGAALRTMSGDHAPDFGR
jgi:hypothetical protein